MSTIKERLEAYRRESKAKQTPEPFDEPVEPADEATQEQAKCRGVVSLSSSPGESSGIWSLPDIDVLDAAPFRLWRLSHDRHPRTTKAASLVLYSAGQIGAAWVEFGMVFFILSLLVLIALSLGKRKEDEVSAYSVFNENCERLLGQMTSEHFERDVLRRRAQ